jgi:hypothetical protein
MFKPVLYDSRVQFIFSTVLKGEVSLIVILFIVVNGFILNKKIEKKNNL